MPAEMTTSPRPHDITGCQGLRREFGHHGPYGPETKHTDPSCTASEITTSKRADTHILDPDRRPRPRNAQQVRAVRSGGCHGEYIAKRQPGSPLYGVVLQRWSTDPDQDLR